jgi:hypothetical protein
VKLGILSDIHEAVELLEQALARFDREGVDRVVVLGDLFETGPRIEATVALLEAAGAVGVFGNHDHGLAVEPSEYIRAHFSGRVLDYMATLRPRLEVDGCLFAHREPWLDGAEVAQIWHVDEEPLTPDLLARSFQATPLRSIFVGHFHRWRAFGGPGPLPWQGQGPLSLPEDGPALVVVNGVCEGYAATFDTTDRLLIPCDLYQGRHRPERRPVPPVLTA